MDRLTRYVTTPHQPDETILYLVSAIKEMPLSIAAQLRAPNTNDTQAQLQMEVITAYIAAYYYATVTNLASQAQLPPVETLTADDGVKKIVDQSFADSNFLESLLRGADATTIATSRLHNLYQETMTNWKPLAKDSSLVYAERASQASTPAA